MAESELIGHNKERATAEESSFLSTISAQADVPLCVDLDGTLVKTDMLWESIIALLRQKPVLGLLLPFWLLRGKAFVKEEIARRVCIEVALLPYQTEVVRFLQDEHRKGRRIILATGSNIRIARSIAEHLGIVDDVIASDHTNNLSGIQKMEALKQQFGAAGFDYVGNAIVDVPIWVQARYAILVNPSQGLRTLVGKCARISHCFGQPSKSTSYLRPMLNAMRVHQWTKNILLLVPLIASHSLLQPARVTNSAIAFIAFSLCASSAYLLNDLLDLEADRSNRHKRRRPLATGELPISLAILLIPLLLLCSGGLAGVLPHSGFAKVLSLYLLLTVTYSLYFKKKALIDVVVLAGLYTLRIFAGSEAIGVETSNWLLTFSIFLFLSLAFVKRYSELRDLTSGPEEDAVRRGYLSGDIQVVSLMGIASGYLSVLVFALYVSSPEVAALYRHPDLLWFICLILLYWISRVWLLAHRGRMHYDPLVFALRDRVSYVAGLLTGVILSIAL